MIVCEMYTLGGITDDDNLSFLRAGFFIAKELVHMDDDWWKYNRQA